MDTTQRTADVVSLALPRQRGCVVIGLPDGLHLLDREGSPLVAAIEPEQTGTRTNDGAGGAAGRLWVGTMAVRQLVHRLGSAALRLQGRNGAHRRRYPRRRRALRGPPAGGVRRLRARADQVPRAVPDFVQSAGMVHRRAASVSAHDAWARADRRTPDRRSGASAWHRPSRTARHPRSLGPHGRVRARPRRRRQPGAPTAAQLDRKAAE